MSFNDGKAQSKKEILDLQKKLEELIELENIKKLQIKDLEMKNSELSNKNFEIQSYLQNLIIKTNLISQENSTLKLEIKKLQLGVNNPGKIISSLETTNKTNINIDNLLKEKSELKESNEKLILVISEREAELLKLKFDYENKIIELKNLINEQKSKIKTINSDINNAQEQLNSKDKELNIIKEKTNSIDYKKLKIDYDLLESNFKKNLDLYHNLENNFNLCENKNKELNERIVEVEKSFSSLVKNGDPKVKDINDLEIYIGINENLREQINEIQNSKEKLEKRYNETSLKNRKDYKTLEDKYLELYEKNIEMQKIIDDGKNNFINDTMKLNNEISNLNDKIKFENKEKEEDKNKYDNLLKDLEKNLLNFENLQNIMTKLREKDDIDITLIEERFILLENILELEKNEISNVNSELINKVKIITQKKEFSARDQINSFIEEKEDKDNDIKLEIKNLSEENKFFKQKIKEQEKRLLDLNKKTNILNIFKEENKTLKNNLNENNVNLQVIIKELINKKNQLNEELLQSRKRTSLLRSNPSYEINNENMKMEIEKYQKEIESLKNEIITQKIKDQEEIERIGNELSSLKTKNAADAFEKDNEIMKCKALIKKYKDLLESNGILKKK